MTNFLRKASLGATLAALTLSATSAIAAAPPTTATGNPQATATVKILKPLTLASTQNLDLGTVALGQGTFSTTVGVAADGTWTCDTTKVTCSSTHQVAKYHVTGTAARTVTVNAGNVTLSNGTANLTLNVDAPATALLDSTGAADFDIGGSVALSDLTPDGVYTGNFAVTADYQ